MTPAKITGNKVRVNTTFLKSPRYKYGDTKPRVYTAANGLIHPGVAYLRNHLIFPIYPFKYPCKLSF